MGKTRAKRIRSASITIPVPEGFVPGVGDVIYVGTHLYLSHGSDDVEGGLAHVVEISEGMSGGENVHFVEVKEHPGHGYNWEQMLAEEQVALRREFGRRWAHEDPDDRPEFNRWD